MNDTTVNLVGGHDLSTPLLMPLTKRIVLLAHVVVTYHLDTCRDVSIYLYNILCLYYRYLQQILDDSLPCRPRDLDREYRYM